MCAHLFRILSEHCSTDKISIRFMTLSNICSFKHQASHVCSWILIFCSTLNKFSIIFVLLSNFNYESVLTVWSDPIACSSTSVALDWQSPANHFAPLLFLFGHYHICYLYLVIWPRIWPLVWLDVQQLGRTQSPDRVTPQIQPPVFRSIPCLSFRLVLFPFSLQQKQTQLTSRRLCFALFHLFWWMNSFCWCF